MKPGEKVKIIFRNNSSIEGIIESWSKDEASLKSLDGKHIFVILNPYEDILLVKIEVQETKPMVKLPEPKPIDLPQEESEDLRIKKLAELRILQNKAERETIANKLKDHNITDTRKVKYEYPGFFQMQSPKQRT